MGTATQPATGRQKQGGGRKSSTKKKAHQQPPLSEEEKAASLELKTQQHDLESLQITFYEIESWIEKTTPLLTRMTKELDKASVQFGKYRSNGAPPPPPLTSTTATTNDNMSMQTSWSTPVTTTTTTTSSSHLPASFMSMQATTTATTTTTATSHSTKRPTSTCPMQWSMSFQPNNSMRLETNIKSVDQLVEAVQQIRLLTDPEDDHSNANSDDTAIPHEDDFLPGCNGLFRPSPTSALFNSFCAPPTTEYWKSAIERRPIICLEQYKHCDMNIHQLTKDVSANIMHYICHLYWDCLHPKFSSDWTTFWDRCDDPKRNQLCIDSGLAMAWLHGSRHDKNICTNFKDVAFFYYDRARDSLMDYFDTPHCATLETLMNLSMFCILCKRHSQSRIYIGLGLRMMLELGMHRRATLPKDNNLLRKKYLKFFMVLYYNDIQSSLYSGEPPLLNDNECDIDFYEVISLNKTLQDTRQSAYDDKIIEKETFFAHLMAIAKIGKQTLELVNDYEKLDPQPHRVHDDLPYRWAKRVQALEIDLGQWYNRLPDYYRVDPQPLSSPPTFTQYPHQYARRHRRHNHCSTSASTSSSTTGEYPHSPMSADDLRAQSALLLMLQYQTQWIILHKTFFNNANSRRCSPQTTTPAVFTPTSTSPSPSSPLLVSTSSSSSTLASSPPCPNKWNTAGTPFQWQRQCTDRSQAICLDAANRIVVISEAITEQFGWCVCQQFISCIYQASTVFCRNAIANNHSTTPERQHANAMIQRIVRVLAASTINYEGLPDDMTKSLIELLNTHSALPNTSLTTTTATATTTDLNTEDIEMISRQYVADNTLSHHFVDTDSNSDVGHGNGRNNNFDFIPNWNNANTLEHKNDITDDDDDDNSSYFTPNTKTIYMPSSPTISIPSPPLLPTMGPSSTDFSTPESISLESPAGLKQQQPRFPMSLDSPCIPTTLHKFNDNLPNSPQMYRQCFTQPRIRSTRHRSLLADQSPTEAMLSIKMKDPVVDELMAMEKANESSSSWRHKFSSPSVAIGNQRII
ncbi:hypothetical protein BC941DRAFT_467248 [Chlamydoabsidia padenii]|nr:hypothetical protein BC941DRAFT_467248 [Chlamydoabsidia padenii]